MKISNEYSEVMLKIHIMNKVFCYKNIIGLECGQADIKEDAFDGQLILYVHWISDFILS